ncbi:hypothetical protein FRC01_001114 [Tulasnella sp. 417]|nr:hypothetical protein FRC01_001114 [Tulasnella sp. 417]
MSPVQDIVASAVQTYLKHLSTPEVSTLLTTDASLAAESAKDSMIEVLKNLQSLVNEEMTKQSTSLKRRRNQEHSRIYQLPHEVFIEITLAATSFALNITDAFTLMRVSKYWFDTVAQCRHIWSRLDLDTRPQPGVMAMMRALRGPLEIQCEWEPELGLDGPVAYLSTLDPTRLRAVVWNWWDKAEALHLFLLRRNAHIIDLAADRFKTYSPQRRFELSPEGLCLRHLDLRHVTLPWTSPRLSRLQTLSIQDIRRDEPSIHDLYRILSLSPALRRIRIRSFQGANQEQLATPHPITEPIFLPELRSLELVSIPFVIINTLLPLIRAPSCQYLELRPRGLERSEPRNRLEPSDAILDLIINPIFSRSMLDIVVDGKEGVLSVSFTSSRQPERNTWGDWDDPHKGISVDLFPPTMESLKNLLDGLISRLKVAGWQPKRFDLSFCVPKNTTLGTEMVPALLLGFPLTFQTITRLDLFMPSSAAYSSALRLLEDEIPELTSLAIFHAYTGSTEETVNGIKAFLERRYPPRLQGNPSARRKISQLAKIYAPWRHPPHVQGNPSVRPAVSQLEKIYVDSRLAECLQGEWPATSLSMKEVLSTTDALK